jgi:tetratricopeptide (TPR) repeat protein
MLRPHLFANIVALPLCACGGEGLPPPATVAEGEGMDLAELCVSGDPSELDAQAMGWLQRGDGERALACYRTLLEREPERALWTTRVAEQLAARGRWEELEVHCERSLGSQIDLTEAERRNLENQLGEALRRQGRNAEALAAFQRSIAGQTPGPGGGPRSFAACPYQGLGELYKAAGHRQRALDSFLRAADAEPGRSDLQLEVARLALELGQIGLALERLERARRAGGSPELEPLARRIEERQTQLADPDTQLSLVLAHFERHEFATAQALASHPGAVQPRVETETLGAIAGILTGEQDRSERQLEDLAVRAASRPSVHVGLAHLSVARRDPEGAERHLARASALLSAPESGPVQPEAWLPLVRRLDALAWGWREANRGEHEAAIAHFDRVLALEPDDRFGLLGKGNSLNALGRLDEAERHLGRVLALDPSNPYAMAELALVAYNRGDDDAAERLFGQAMEIEPERYTCPHEGLGLVYLRRGENEHAQTHFERAIEVNPDIEYAKYNGLARIHLAQGRLDQAESLLRKSIENYPHDDEARQLLEEIERLREGGAAPSPPATDGT